jgi:hypothetical protein
MPQGKRGQRKPVSALGGLKAVGVMRGGVGFKGIPAA